MSPDTVADIDEFVPASQAELGRFVRENAAGPRRPLFPAGGRTALNFGYAPKAPGVTVSTANLSSIVDYPARDMTITVEAGIRMEQLAAALKTENQQLPIDVPQAHRATLGGVAATNTSGPRRSGYGTMRDYAIGIAAVDSDGRLFHAGGRVVKNVAGYDLCKLLIGSLGTLGIITELTLKLRPLPETAALVWATLDSYAIIEEALANLANSETRPVAVEVLNPAAAEQVAVESRKDVPARLPVLAVCFEGGAAEVAWQIDRLKRELAGRPRQIEVVAGGDVAPVMTALTEYQIQSEDPLTFQAQLLPSRTMAFMEQLTQQDIAAQAHAVSGVVVGHLSDTVTSAAKAESILAPLRRQARDARGNLGVWDCPAEWKPSLPVFGAPDPAWPFMGHLKKTLDPHGLLNPGRFLDLP